VVSFDGTPVALATPQGRDSWIARRLAQFGDAPAVFLLRSRDLGETERRFPCARRGSWLNHPMFWLDPGSPEHPYLGVIQAGETREAR
jgi:hypothetical protein